MEEMMATRARSVKRYVVRLSGERRELEAMIGKGKSSAARLLNLFLMFAPLEGWRHVKVTDRRAMRFALADAFDLGERAANRSSGREFARPEGQRQRPDEGPAQGSIVLGLADDVAQDPAKIGAHAVQRAVGALELLGVGVALMAIGACLPTRA
jgi:hypothetical protein